MKKISERDKDYLATILDHCDRVSSCVERFGKDLDIFLGDADFRDAVMMNIFQIGEASNQLGDECREMMSDVPWSQIYGMRNRIAHAYLKVDDEIVWDVAVNDIPKLKETTMLLLMTLM